MAGTDGSSQRRSSDPLLTPSTEPRPITARLVQFPGALKVEDTVARLSIHKLRDWKHQGQRFAMLTAYDYPSARLVEQAGIPIILVGDSLGSVILGYDSTVPVTMEDIVYHTRAVVRATTRCIVREHDRRASLLVSRRAGVQLSP